MSQRRFKFRLYVAGNAHNSTLAVANLTSFCRQHLAHKHDLQVVDVFREPELALADSVLMTPMLLILRPLPQCRIVGSLNEPALLLRTLGLEPLAA